MIGRALNSNNDIFLSQGQFKLVNNGAEVVQHVRTRLQFYQGEWFSEVLAGVPYFQEIFKKPTNLANVESIFKTTILNTPGVEKLTFFSMEYDGGSNRELSISFSAETTYGIIDNEKVTINE